MTEDIFVFEMCADYYIGNLRMLLDFSQVRVAYMCVRITLGCLRMSSDSPSLDDKGADDDVSLCV